MQSGWKEKVKMEASKYKRCLIISKKKKPLCRSVSPNNPAQIRNDYFILGFHVASQILVGQLYIRGNQYMCLISFAHFNTLEVFPHPDSLHNGIVKPKNIVVHWHIWGNHQTD